MFGQLAKNTLAQVAAKVVVIFISLALIRLITGTLGRDGYGVYGFVTAIVLLFATIADWGTSIIAVREASKDKAIQAKVFGTATFTRFILVLAAFIAINVIVRIYSPWQEFVIPLTIGSLVLLFLSVKTSMAVVFQTFLKFNLAAVVEIVGAISFLLLVLFFLGRAGGVNGVIIAWVLSAAIAAVLAATIGWGAAKGKFGLDRHILKNLVLESLPMGMFLLFFSIYNRVDIIILEYFRGIGDVAVYNLAYKIHDNLVLGAAFLMASAFPVISRMYANNKDANVMLMRFYRKLLVVLTIGGLLVAFVFFLGAPLVIQLLTGDQFIQFSDSVTVLKILVFATFFSYLNHLTGFSLIAFGKQKTILFVGTVALFFNVIANLIFIPRYSWTAAATVTVVTELIVFLLTSYFISATIFKRNAQT
ncbi:oligosaccharide flippase family protein [Candidatus Microgenomates bacterium]|nr:oligosaccharide flippase family protein [Candidatus Microgenomates bacterium]